MAEKFFLVAVDMGYGHQRAAYPLRQWAINEEVILANNYLGIPEKDKKIWLSSQRSYEFISRFKSVSFLGSLLFFLFDQFQKIVRFYPKRDLSQPNFYLKQVFALIKKGWGKDLIEKLKIKNRQLKTNLPLITTFFVPAFMAEYHQYPGEIFCLVCDSDVARVWAPLDAQKSRIKYLAPTERVVERLQLYGVKKENIFLTGFPLPLSNLGDEDLTILKNDLRYRLLNLDPQKRFQQNYQPLIEKHLLELPQQANHPLTLLFSVGGAGAQKEIAVQIVRGLAEKIKRGEIRVILSAGIKKQVKDYFAKELANQKIEILWADNFATYFEKFNFALRQTDILWTKPSELSFYAALGLPIIIAPAVGSQEEFNQRWLLKSGFGLMQEDPRFVQQWLFDWLAKGYLAEAALQGFVEGEKLGIFKIQKLCSGS